MIKRDHNGEGHYAQVNGTIPLPSRPGAKVFRDIAEYTMGRKVIGTTLLEVPLLNSRRVHLWTVDGGEHILILEQNRSFLYWEVSLEPLESAKKRACDWLTEPPTNLM